MKRFGMALGIAFGAFAAVAIAPMANAFEDNPWSNMPDLRRLVEKQSRDRQLAGFRGQNCDEMNEASQGKVGAGDPVRGVEAIRARGAQ